MIEAVGHDRHETYLAKCAGLLRPRGRLLIQAITIEDERYDRYRREVDFIQRHVFPGSCLPSVARLRELIGRAGQLEISSVEDIGRHYATTLNHWRRNFLQRQDEVRALGYPTEFIRLWEFYLCYCEGGFLERSIGDVLLVAERRPE
jgi:cyclopropane-fatty-acyl-phospholipid synthase